MFEASHGQGAPDGVRGAVKRTADLPINQGMDIPDAKTLFETLRQREMNIRFWYIDEDVITESTRNMSASLPCVEGTMKIHQLLTFHHGEIQYRDVSCFCAPSHPSPCKCYNPQTFRFVQETSVSEVSHDSSFDLANQATEPGPSDDRLHHGILGIDPIGKFCLVRYEGAAYPGKVLDIDELDVKVKCMCRVGSNRFYWPSMDDILWYSHEDILCAIPPPQNVTARHVEVDKDIWNKIQNTLGE